MPIQKTDKLTAPDGISIYYRLWHEEPRSPASLVIAHGLGEHSGRYAHVAERLVSIGLSVWALDHRGHGQSDGKRGHILAFKQYVTDLKLLIETAISVSDGHKPFLLGHSMGGLIALTFALDYQNLIAGLILSSPALGVAVAVPAIKKLLGRIMSRVWPGLTMSNELDHTKISHDQTVVKAYHDDPLVHDRVSARWFTEFIAAMAATNQRAEQLRIPILMQIAGDDRLVDAQVSRNIFPRLGTSDKTIKVYDGLYHEIYNEVPEQRAGVLSDLDSWLTARIS